ncbi:hypothetical protein OG618_31905 [Kitasatospora sp. NBC_01246]|uniref:hypothetical protein n=1 Tax=Kitasatospora sp. NBC_01246 TaxID=2903570 RepID=UPI002E30C627|nr:hypothetical protein [Kitasatospora sp. NBC_01246]
MRARRRAPGGLDEDVVLERTAAMRRLSRRVVHVLLIGASGPVGVVVRDSVGLVGLVGLAALGAALCGASFA